MRRLAIALISAALAVAGGLGLAGGTAGATAATRAPRSVALSSSTPPTTTTPPGTAGDGTGNAADLAPVDVLQVSGLFDAVVVDSIEQAVDRSEHNGSQALVLQMSSDGATVSRATMSKLQARSPMSRAVPRPLCSSSVMT